MMRRIGRYLGNNLLGLMALVVALGGTAYAAATIGSAEIIDDSVRSVDIKTGEVKGTDLVDDGVTGVDLRNGTVRAADLASAPWLTVGPVTDIDNCPATVTEFCAVETAQWRNYLDGYQLARYRKDLTGEVYLEGLVEEVGAGASLANRPIFVLPQGYRPAANQLVIVACGDGGTDKHGTIEIRTTGEVVFRALWTPCSTLNYVSLSGISFYAG